MTGTEPGTSCTAYGTWPSRVAAAKSPTVGGIDYTPGLGNDSQWVRFRTRLVNSSGTYATHRWSGWAVARDNQSAVWSGTQYLYMTGLSSYWMMVDIEWWNSTQRLGSLTLSVSQYWTYYPLVSNSWIVSTVC
ncbi:MAG TPA: hypothetical protein VM848_12035 [Acidimicrobiia bacterium]|nr:hypothetical protein [Acidimicrobiia bacterium]